MKNGISLALLALVVVGIGFAPAGRVDVSDRVGTAVLLLAYAGMLAIVLRLPRGNAGGRRGRTELVAGLALLTAGQCVSLLSVVAGDAALRFSGGRFALAGLGIALEAAGALGMALGLGAWLGGLAARSVTSEGEVAALEEKVHAQSQQIEKLRSTDELTGVLNQHTFHARLEETVQRDSRLRKPFAFFLVQPVGLRAYGRHAADAGLQEIGCVLQSVSRGTDFVGRVGDDEFALALGECEDPRPVATRIQSALSTERRKDKPPLRVRIGVVTGEWTGEPVDVNELFRLAEEAARSLGDVRDTQWACRCLAPSIAKLVGRR